MTVDGKNTEQKTEQPLIAAVCGQAKRE